jgi:hypothetical protein
LVSDWIVDTDDAMSRVELIVKVIKVFVLDDDNNDFSDSIKY